MNRPPVVNQSALRILYYRYKAFFIPVVTFLVSIALLVEFIIPQVQLYFSSQDDIAQAQAKLDAASKNFNLITSLDSDTINRQLAITSHALPQDKDFQGILDAISNAAIISGVILGDYSFQVGDVSQLKASDQTFLELALNITGNIAEVKRFIVALKNQFPLSDITGVQINGINSSNVTVVFYYKPFPTIPFDTTTTIVPLSAKEESLLRSLSAVTIPANPNPFASSSALQQ